MWLECCPLQFNCLLIHFNVLDSFIAGRFRLYEKRPLILYLHSWCVCVGNIIFLLFWIINWLHVIQWIPNETGWMFHYWLRNLGSPIPGYREINFQLNTPVRVSVKQKHISEDPYVPVHQFKLNWIDVFRVTNSSRSNFFLSCNVMSMGNVQNSFKVSPSQRAWK